MVTKFEVRVTNETIICILSFPILTPFYLGQTHRKGSKDKGRRLSNNNGDEEDDIDNDNENDDDDLTNNTHNNKSQHQPQQKLEGKVAKMIEKAEQRRLKRISRQKEVFMPLYLCSVSVSYNFPVKFPFVSSLYLMVQTAFSITSF